MQRTHKTEQVSTKTPKCFGAHSLTTNPPLHWLIRERDRDVNCQKTKRLKDRILQHPKTNPPSPPHLILKFDRWPPPIFLCDRCSCGLPILSERGEGERCLKTLQDYVLQLSVYFLISHVCLKYYTTFQLSPHHQVSAPQRHASATRLPRDCHTIATRLPLVIYT